MGDSTLWAVFSGRPGVSKETAGAACHSPMMVRRRVALRTRPFGVAFGRVTHAPAQNNLYRAMKRGLFKNLRRAALGSMAWENPHRSLGAELFKEGIGVER